MTPVRSVHPWRRRVAALLAFAVTLLAAALVYSIGLLSDWSGQHRIPPQTIVAAIVILVVGSLVSLWILRRGR